MGLGYVCGEGVSVLGLLVRHVGTVKSLTWTSMNTFAHVEIIIQNELFSGS